MKKIVSLVLALFMLATVTAFAKMNKVEDYSFVINGEVMQDASVYEKDDILYIPLRAICEKLGFQVNWVNDSRTVELVKLPVFITFSVDEDGYTFAKTAPMKLGSAPVIVNDRTYVPSNFVTEILAGSLEVSSEEKAVVISYGEEVFNEVTFVEVDSDGKVVVEDEIGETVLLNVTEETIIRDNDGNALKVSDIKEGDKLEVKYGETMTLSLPAQTNAVEIVVLGAVEAEKEEVPYIDAVYVETDETGRILIDSFLRGKLLLNITEETVINDAEGNAVKKEDLTAEKALKVKVSEAMTMSIPAQTNAVEIIVTDEFAPLTKEGVVSEVTQEGQIVVGTMEDEEFFALNLSEETVILDKDGEVVTADSIKKDTKIVASVSAIATRSIPAQHTAYAIRIAE